MIKTQNPHNLIAKKAELTHFRCYKRKDGLNLLQCQNLQQQIHPPRQIILSLDTSEEQTVFKKCKDQAKHKQVEHEINFHWRLVSPFSYNPKNDDL